MGGGQRSAVSAQRGGAFAAHPFLKWAGGKAQMLEQYRSLFPREFGQYVEPFVGGGAVFFDLHARGLLHGGAWLADANEELVNAYRAVRDEPEQLLALLTEYQRLHCEEFYYTVRRWEGDHPLRLAARFVYLNRTCFNGLYRVNAKGLFNVPHGKYENPRICDEDGIRAASAALQRVMISSLDFRQPLFVARIDPGDFVYFDPPYDVTSKTARFTSFTRQPFGWAEQEALSELFGQLAARGVKCMLSNADTERVRELYKDWDVRTVGARRAINSSGDKRGTISEVVVLSYDPEAP